MARGTVDWEVMDTTRILFRVTDLAEQAARLGSIDLFQRSGNVYFTEEFEAGLDPWFATISGAGAAADLSATWKRTGMFSARLVGGSDASRLAYISRIVPVFTLSRFGMEVAVGLPGAFESFELRLIVTTGSIAIEAGVRYTDSTDDFEMLVSGGGYSVALANQNLRTAVGAFHPVKFTMDPNALVYGSLFVGGRRVDISALALESGASALAPSTEARLTVISRSGQNDVVYMDDVILTDGEVQ